MKAANGGSRDRSATRPWRLVRALRRHGRMLWWFAAGTPPLVALMLLLAEPLHPPDLADGYDLSDILYHLSAVLTVVVGVIMVVATTRRLGHDLETTSGRNSRTQRERLRTAREARFRSAWLLLIAALLIALGFLLTMLPEYALS